MIRIYSLYDGWCLTEITPICKQIQLSASISQPARKCTFSMVYSLTDENQPRVQIGPGTLIAIKDEAYGEIFRGQVIDRTMNSQNQEESFTCVDYMKFFMKSSTSMNVKNMTPEDVAYKACSELEIESEALALTNIPVKRLCPNMTYYNIIMQCYTQASKQNGKQYIPIMKGEKFNIIEKGQIVSNFTLQSDYYDTNNNTVLGLNYKDTIDNMINKVKIFDSENNYIDTIEEAELKSKYGVMQTTYTKEKDKDAYVVAQNKIFGFSDEISIEAMGEYSCITGYAVPVKIWYLGLLNNATAYINEDTHTWECGTGRYTMKLTLSLDNTMDLQGVDN